MGQIVKEEQIAGLGIIGSQPGNDNCRRAASREFGFSDAMTYRLVIGNKNTSSWSLRPWLAMRHAQIPFSEVNINLRAQNAKQQILAHSPAGRVPVLLADGLCVWDSLAILEHLAELHPEAQLWPRPDKARARARSVSAEMHSGFQALRQHCPMDFLARTPKTDLPNEVAADVVRIVTLWEDCRQNFGSGGPYLFGAFSLADCMYAPVASRFRTYLPELEPYGDNGTAQAYVKSVFAHPAMTAWQHGALAEK
jgi:glutathione S-transferase